MNWDDLRVFLAVARHGSLSAAGRSLGLTQPTIGRRLNAMEAQMGARLLHRTPERYILTPLGESVMQHAERIETEFLTAERIISGHDCALEGKVRLTTVDTLAARVVVPALARLQQDHPGIVVELMPDTRQLSLARREADIAIRMTRFEGHEVITRKLGTLGMAFYAARGYDAASPAARIITVMDDMAHLPEAHWLRQHYPDAPVALQSNTREAQLWAARHGMGVACLVCYRADQEPDLVRVQPELPLLRRDIWLGIHRDMRDTPRMRAVMDVMTDMVARRAAELCPE
ncbi:MAG: LysR family transcriptional regulator [Sphingobium sp.]|nr:LysR family transcriptional regulator [Sphingobium sp.]